MKENMQKTDEELLKNIKNGDENAENELFSRYKDMVVKISRGYFLVGGDLEDIIQEGMIGLYHAVKSYNPEKDASFKTFAVVCIRHQIQSAIKKANTKRNEPLSSAVSFQTFSEATPSENVEFLPMELILETTPVERAINKEDFESLKNMIKQTLSSMEKHVLKLYLQGYSYREISQTLNLSQKSIDNSLSRIKSKLRAKLNAQQ